jgi:hypothetical protein
VSPDLAASDLVDQRFGDLELRRDPGWVPAGHQPLADVHHQGLGELGGRVIAAVYAVAHGGQVLRCHAGLDRSAHLQPRLGCVSQAASWRADIQRQVIDRPGGQCGVELLLLSGNQVRYVGYFFDDRERECGFAMFVPGCLQPVVVVAATPQLGQVRLPPSRDVIRRADINAARTCDPVDTHPDGRAFERKRRAMHAAPFFRLAFGGEGELPYWSRNQRCHPPHPRQLTDTNRATSVPARAENCGHQRSPTGTENASDLDMRKLTPCLKRPSKQRIADGPPLQTRRIWKRGPGQRPGPTGARRTSGTRPDTYELDYGPPRPLIEVINPPGDLRAVQPERAYMTCPVGLPQSHYMSIEGSRGGRAQILVHRGRGEADEPAAGVVEPVEILAHCEAADSA